MKDLWQEVQLLTVERLKVVQEYHISLLRITFVGIVMYKKI